MTRRGLGLTLGFLGVLLLVGVVVAGLLMSTALSSFFGSASNSRPEIQADLVRAADRAGDGGTVKLAEVVPGSWDTSYVWGGYSADMDHAAFPGVDFGSGAYGQDYVLAFAANGKLVSWDRFNVNDPLVYFDPPADGIRTSRNDAVFTVIKDVNYPAGYLLRPGN